jgi:hypothetical protein
MLRSSSAATLLAVGAASGQLSTCSTSTPGLNILPGVLDQLQKAVVLVCPIIPAIVTLVAVIAAKFPAVAGVASITDEMANNIASTVCKLFEQSGVTTAQAGELKGELKASLEGKDVPLSGFRIVNGKPVWF